MAFSRDSICCFFILCLLGCLGFESDTRRRLASGCPQSKPPCCRRNRSRRSSRAPPAAGRLTGSPRKDPGVGTVGLGTGARVGQLHKMASLGWSRMSSQDPKSLNHGEERAKESKPGQFRGPQGELWFLADKPDWSPPISAQLPPAGAPPGGQNRPQPTSQPTPSSPGDIDVTRGLAL